MQRPKKLKVQDYEVFQTLGQGAFGRVKLAKSKVSNKWVAMKYMSKSEIVKMKQVDHVINENTLLYNV